MNTASASSASVSRKRRPIGGKKGSLWGKMNTAKEGETPLARITSRKIQLPPPYTLTVIPESVSRPSSVYLFTFRVFRSTMVARLCLPLLLYGKKPGFPSLTYSRLVLEESRFIRVRVMCIVSYRIETKRPHKNIVNGLQHINDVFALAKSEPKKYAGNMKPYTVTLLRDGGR